MKAKEKWNRLRNMSHRGLKRVKTASKCREKKKAFFMMFSMSFAIIFSAYLKKSNFARLFSYESWVRVVSCEFCWEGRRSWRAKAKLKWDENNTTIQKKSCFSSYFSLLFSCFLKMKKKHLKMMKMKTKKQRKKSDVSLAIYHLFTI